MMDVPEFCFDNKLDILKPKDVAILSEYLVEKEKAEEARRNAQKEAEAAAANAGISPVKGGKADPKKDAKGAKAPAKGAAPVDDKNGPQNITVAVPNIESLPNFLICEKQYNARPAPKISKKMDKKAAATTSKEDKTKERLDELLLKYQIHRSLPFSMEVNLRLNKEVEVARLPTPEAPEPVVEDPKSKGKKK